MARVEATKQAVNRAVARLHAQLQEAGVTTVELRQDVGNDLYLSIPTESYEAVEVEAYGTPSGIYFTLTRRAWDRTGGLCAEMEVGESNQPHLVVAMIKADLAHLAEEAAKLEAAMASADPDREA